MLLLHSIPRFGNQLKPTDSMRSTQRLTRGFECKPLRIFVVIYNQQPQGSSIAAYVIHRLVTCSGVDRPNKHIWFRLYKPTLKHSSDRRSYFVSYYNGHTPSNSF